MTMLEPLPISSVGGPAGPVGDAAWYRELLDLDWDGCEADVYLCFSDAPRMRLSGFLVTDREDLHRVVAYCAISLGALELAESGQRLLLRREINRHLAIARRIAMAPELAGREDQAIHLADRGTALRPMPHWVYGLTCIPLNRPWDGCFRHPVPYCEVAYGTMTAQLTRRARKPA